MTAFVVTGFVMGALGSLHCIGMCGPLALSLPVVKEDLPSRFMGSLLYNIGRTITYAVVGAITGLLGKSFALFGYQQALSLALGIAIILFVLFPKLGRGLNQGRLMPAFFEKVRSGIGRLYFKKNYSAILVIGLLNGLLPCGLVMMALAASLASADLMSGTLFMAGFGLGTIPLMWSLTFFGGFISINLRRKLRGLYPYLMVIMACLLIIRGLGWGIPYLSPALHNDSDHVHQGIDCH